jgi:phage anti-repressor protein/predicted GIY-YIG superfamily endonuclease
MKITEFLKKYSTIDNKFIDDFYTFYDDGKNEYDFTINLQLIAKWLNVRKDDLKKLLISNFIENRDYVQIKESGKKGTGKNNLIHVLLTYNCSKLLCMISKCQKSNLIRNYYIDLEKLIITYKDNIVNDLHNQLGIRNRNQIIMNENKKEGLIYVLKVDDETYKIGSSVDIKKRMKQYNVGRVSELPIVFAYKTSDIKTVESCIKNNLENYRLKKNKNNELFKIDHEFIKDTIIYCNKFNTLKVKENNKLYKAKDDKNWMIIIDKKNTDINQLFKEVKKYKRKTTSKKPSKKSSKK